MPPDGVRRRALLLGAAAGAAAGAAPPALAVGTIGESGPKALFKALINSKLEQYVTADWGLLLQLLLLDAATYNKEARAGGVNGSVRFEPLDAYHPKLVDVVAQIDAAKRAFDADEGAAGPISWADTLVLAGLRGLVQECEQSKAARNVGPGQGNAAPTAKLGRVDATQADPGSPGIAPTASVADFKALFKRLGLTTTDLCLLAPVTTGDLATGNTFLASDPECAAKLESIEKSKRDPSRTSYEVPRYRAYVALAGKISNFGPVPFY